MKTSDGWIESKIQLQMGVKNVKERMKRNKIRAIYWQTRIPIPIPIHTVVHTYGHLI